MQIMLHIVLTRSPIYKNTLLYFELNNVSENAKELCYCIILFSRPFLAIFEPSYGKTNNVVFEQVWHKSGCTVTEAG